MVFVMLGLAPGARAQTAADLEEGIRLEPGAVEGEYTLKWWGKAGRTYFIETSEDLLHWTYLPVIEAGTDGVIQWGFGSLAEGCFLRLRHTDTATGGDALTADFDGDGVSNMAELQAGFDPLDAQSTPPVSPLIADLPAGSPRVWPLFDDYPEDPGDYFDLAFNYDTSKCELKSLSWGAVPPHQYARTIWPSSGSLSSESRASPHYDETFQFGSPSTSAASALEDVLSSTWAVSSNFTKGSDDLWAGTGTSMKILLHLVNPVWDTRTDPVSTCPVIKQFAKFNSEGEPYNGDVFTRIFPRTPAADFLSLGRVTTNDLHLAAPPVPVAAEVPDPGSETRSYSLRVVNYLPQSFSLSDSAGPAHRKIGLNGFPLSDAKPQAQDESGELREETFVDAYSRQLRHSVSDVYVSTDSTLLPLQVRRSVTPEAWSRRFGPTLEERMDKPFGPGWSSNLTPFITFEATLASSAATPGNIHLYSRAVVTDEQGGQRTFLRSNSGAWLGTREAGQSAKTSFDRLEQTGPGTFVLRQKFGTTCHYELIFNSQGKPESRSRPADRLMASSSVKYRAYARMTQVVDRLGNRLVYTYADSPNLKSLIPHTIHDPARPAHRISIQQEDGRIVCVQGADGELVHYEYEDMTSPGAQPMPAVCKVLSRVSRGGPGQAMPETGGVSYEYDATADHDPTPDPADAHETEFIHLELGSITDERGHNHQFSYRDGTQSVFDRGWEYEIFSGDGPSGYEWRIQTGLPRLLTRITLPDARTVHFSGDRGASITTGGSLVMDDEIAPPPRCNTTVTGDCGTYTYIFDDPYHYQPFVDHDPSGGLIEYLGHQATLTFTRLQICHGTGAPADPRETFTFSPAAGMAPDSVTDLDGRATTFEYDDEAQVIPNLPGVLMPPSIYHDDPTAEVSPIHNTLDAWDQPMNGRKTFTYDPATRVMTSMTDPRGVRTTYKLKPSLPGQRPTGLRVKETVTDENNAVLRVTDFEYNHPVFKGFMTRQILRTNGLPTEAQGSMGERITTLTPDANGRTSTQSVALGGGQPPAVTSFTYTGSGMKQTVTDPRQHTTTFEYEPDTLRLKKVTHPDLSTRQLFYDAHGNLEREVNEIGVTTFHDYDVFNRRVKTTLDLNGNGLKDPRYTQFTPAAGGQPATYNGDIVTETTYTVHHLPEDEWDARGIRTRHTYDTLGRRLTTTVNFGDPDPAQVHTTRFTDDDTETPDFVGGSVFNVSGFKPLRVTDPRGFTTEFEYDALYRVTKTTLTDTSYTPHQVIETRTRYDDAGNPILTLDALGRGTHTTYDGLGRATTVTYPADVNTPVASTHTFYTPGGQVWKSVDETGAITRHTYDQAGRVKTTTLPAVLNPATGQPQTPLIQHTHDAAGNLTHVEDPRGNITQTLYDNRNRPWKVIQPQVTDATTGQPAAPATLTHYDDAGRVTGQTDPLGHFTETVLDRAGRALQTIAPQIGAQTHITRRSFDAAGNILTLTDPENHTTTNTYDAHNRLLSTLDAEAILNEFEYDKAGNRTLARDGLQQETTFSYDAQNRPLTQTHANLDTWSWTYNALQKTGQLDAKLVTTTYTYDARDRLRTLAAPGIERLHTYDLAGRLLTVSETGRPEAAITNTWDAHGRLMSETSRGLTHSHAYDLAGNRVSTTYSTGRNVTTTHDAHNRPATITEGVRTTLYGYDKAGRAVLMTAGNGQTTNNTYDALGRLTDRTLFQTPAMQENEVLVQLGWDHDAAGNVRAQHETWPGSPARPTGIRSTLMGYDDNYRLTSETIQTRADAQSQPVTQSTATYTYDDANNRLTKTVTGGTSAGHWTYTSNEANQLETWTRHDAPAGTLIKSAELTYDANGNRETLSITEGATTSTITYSWDALDRLTGVEMPDGTLHSYSYDHRTRRHGITRSGGSLPPHQTALTFTGGLSAAEWEAENATPDPVNTAPTVEYQRGPDMGGGVGGILYSKRGSTLKYSLSNGRGDIIAQSDAAATITWTASYEAGGKRPIETGLNPDKQRGNSKDEDPTGLLNEGRRYRELEHMVWLSRDPAGFVDGLNLYAYVKQNSWSAFDPEGLDLTHLAQAWMKGDFSFKTFANEFTPLPGVMQAPNDIGRAAYQAISDGNRIAQTYNGMREAGATRAQAGTAAGVMTLGLATGALPVAEAVNGNRIVATNDGSVTTQKMETGERIVQGTAGAVQMGFVYFGASSLRTSPTKSSAVTVVENEAVVSNAPKGAPSGPTVGELRAAGQKDAHHIIQDAAVRDLPGYNTNAAPGVQLQGPSTAVGSPHYNATQIQRQAGGGTYGAERRIGYKAMRKGGLSPEDARGNIERADAYFETLGVDKTTPLRVPGNRR